ncbi:UDP-glucuronosyltransferase 2B17 [Diachasma alloeum]|uniref:UDP-glucuronosyltransferase 2B17 n=1 Tax=Diachasma alloeum TaxID=454923 RepID=UPI00073812D9|nr:UDP-glucuronosyltransferase 2B17 [Diachasma alloeum]
MGFKIFGSIISIFLISCAIESASHRILAIFPFQSRSHQMMFDALIKGLVDRGHQMDVMTVYPMKKPLKNYTVVVNLEGKQESLVNQWNVKFASELGDDTLPIIALPFGNGLCEYLGLPEMQAIIKNPPQDPPYDLVIVESFGANCFIGLGHVLNVPVIMASSTVPLPWLETSLGQVQYPAFVPAFFTSHKHPMSFFDRVLNTVKTYSNNIRYRYYTEAVQNAQMRKYIDSDIPPLRELEKNVVLALVNSWHSLNPIQPVTPGVIGVAGLHVDANYVPLPKEMEKWMNDSTSGVIYFTLGSMVNIETFPDETMRAIYSVFRGIAPVRVLMKVANKTALLPGLPDNVMTSSWIPQVAVLAHKNTKMFITHGGLMGTQEALTYGVPLIGIPLFGDQHNNIVDYHSLGMAIELDIHNLSEESISWAVNEILHNPKYREAAKHQSMRFLDRPMSAMDTAVYWVEYAIRHGRGALRSPVVDLSWWQVALLDVYGFLSLSILLAIYLIFRIAKASLTAVTSTKNGKRVKSD